MEPKALARKKRVILPVIAAVLYTVIGFFILPPVLRNVITNQLTDALNRPVSIERIRINPYALTVDVRGVIVQDRETKVPFVSADRLFANASILSVLTFSGVLSEFRIENPTIALVIKKDGTFNFSDLLDTTPETSVKQESRTPGNLPGFTIENAGLTGGKILVDDQAAGIRHEIRDLSFLIPSISSKPGNSEEQVRASMALLANGSEFNIRASGRPFQEGMASEVQITTGTIDLRHYLSYIPLPQGLDIASLDVNLTANLSFKRVSQRSEIGMDATLNLLNARIHDENQNELAGLPQAQVHVQTPDLFSGRIRVPGIVIDRPRMTLRRDETGHLNIMTYITGFQALQEQGDENRENRSPDDKHVVLLLDKLQVADGRIDFEDLSQDTAFKTVLAPLNINLTGFELDQTASGTFALDFATATGAQMKTGGRFTQTPLRVDGSLSISDLHLEDFRPYFERFIHVDLISTAAALETDYAVFKSGDTLDADISAEQILLSDIEIKDRQSGKSIISVPEFKVTGAGLNVLEQKVTSGRIETRNGKISLIRDSEGRFNLVPPASKKTPTEDAQASLESAGSRSDFPWAITLDELDLAGFSIDVFDSLPKESVTASLTDISLSASQLSSVAESEGRVKAEMTVNDRGSISINGTVLPSAASADLQVALENLDIKSVQPYFAEAVQVSVTRGSVSTNGRVRLNLNEDAATKLVFDGEAAVKDFVSLDKKTSRDFFRCNSFHLAGVNVSLLPLAVNIRDVSLTDFYSLIRIGKDGRLNLSEIFTAATEQKTAAVQEEAFETADGEAEQPRPRIRVTSVTLQGGQLDFSDLMTQPNFHATMKQIAGSVEGLSSDPETRATVHLKGLHGNSSPLDIRGFINPLASEKYADIDLTFKDIELSSFTPYAAKYLGYKIEKGKLILDLKYLIDGNALTSENRIRFDNLTLGESVESDEATSLPVRLAISLLKDSKDQINLDLPVKGHLDDPEFKIGAVILKMMANLIVKVVTSPFSIIGAMFGGGEDLGYVEFEYGDHMLDGSDTIKLDTLAKILAEKPDISLEIQSRYHPQKDVDAMIQMAWTDLLKAEKRRQLIAQGVDIDDSDDVQLAQADIPGLIETAYEAADFPKPRDESGLEKVLETEEKKKLLITHINIAQGDLRQLAMKRSEAVKAYLVSTGKITSERIFLLEPIQAESKKEQAPDAVRVTFMLK